MIPKYLSDMWATLGPGLGDHLWQSTLFAVVAGLLTFVLRKNHARARYWLWLSASLKFLVPFSVLAGIGSQLAWMRSPAETEHGFYLAVNEVSQPFSQVTAPASSQALSSAASPSLMQLFPMLLAVLWLCGLVVILAAWYMRWRKISSTTRKGVPLHEGREVVALRRMERIAGLRRPIRLLLSQASLEPGIFGIGRPVLLWPAGISEHLEDAHVEAIVAHEVLHVRRHDNLAAAIHMLVEAIFWFHPLVWWLGARLVEERERACDEGALELGSERQIYAESILKTCQFCVGFPLACVSGVTGADLKRRIMHIMTQSAARQLDFSKKLLLGTTGLVAIAIPTMLGLLNAPQGRAESQVEKAVESVSVSQSYTNAHTTSDPLSGKATSKAVPAKGKTCSRSARARKLASEKLERTKASNVN